MAELLQQLRDLVNRAHWEAATEFRRQLGPDDLPHWSRMADDSHGTVAFAVHKGAHVCIGMCADSLLNEHVVEYRLTNRQLNLNQT